MILSTRIEMEATKMENLTLSNGVKMPLEGFGVFQIPEPEICKQAVLDAIKNGYRLLTRQPVT